MEEITLVRPKPLRWREQKLVACKVSTKPSDWLRISIVGCWPVVRQEQYEDDDGKESIENQEAVGTRRPAKIDLSSRR